MFIKALQRSQVENIVAYRGRALIHKDEVNIHKKTDYKDKTRAIVNHPVSIP